MAEQPATQQPKPLGERSHLANSVQKKHGDIMRNFDDIPISKIQKMPGYQTGAELANALDDDVGQPPANFGVSPRGADAGDHPVVPDMALEDRARDGAWKVRLEAFKEIRQLFE